MKTRKKAVHVPRSAMAPRRKPARPSMELKVAAALSDCLCLVEGVNGVVHVMILGMEGCELWKNPQIATRAMYAILHTMRNVQDKLAEVESAMMVSGYDAPGTHGAAEAMAAPGATV
ncbi:hypothetical protein [Dyella sp.]|uniref:hypothetical protein n=1 Tax=Dyella sp. TaxID=1869338 RepID=UPI002FD9CA09